jgi:hypothetical protein
MYKEKIIEKIICPVTFGPPCTIILPNRIKDLMKEYIQLLDAV